MKSQMKVIFSIIITIFFSITFSQSLSVPFYESFENIMYSPSWQIQQLTQGRIISEVVDKNYANSLNLTVKKHDHTAMAVKTDGRTRAEIALLNHHLENNDVYFYSWDLLIPKNQTFKSNSNENYFVIMQWHEEGDGTPTYCLKGENIKTRRAFPVSLRLIPESLDQDSKMNLHLKYGTTYGPGNASNDGDICPQDKYSKGYREYVIEKGIKLGEWNRIVTQIKWSVDGDSAFIRIWINDLPVINQINTENYKRKGTNPNLFLGNTDDDASTLGGVPLLYTHLENGIEVIDQNYPKLGHYRKNYETTNTIYIDNYRITTEYPPKPFTTSLTDKYCNKEFPAQEDYILEAYDISPAQRFLFRFTDNSNQNSNEIQNKNQLINLMEQSWVRAGKTYDVSVRALNILNQGNGFAYGKSCKITLPKATKLYDYFSGKNASSPYILNKNELIRSYPLPSATDYLYKLSDPQDSTHVIWIPGNDKNGAATNLSKVSGLNENTLYKISAKASRLENGKDVYSGLNTGSPDYIKIKKLRKNIDKKFEMNINAIEGSLYIKSKSNLDNIYLISKTGEILLKSGVNEKEAKLNINPFKNNIYQITAIDKKENVFIQFYTIEPN